MCGTMGRGEGSPAVLHDQFLARDHMVPTVGVVGPVRSFPPGNAALSTWIQSAAPVAPSLLGGWQPFPCRERAADNEKWEPARIHL